MNKIMSLMIEYIEKEGGGYFNPQIRRGYV